jgi:3-phenylpropionate/cinnamic acid dioxygenase small subunit
MQTAQKTEVDAKTRAEVNDFLVREAELLDSGKFGEWLKLFSKDIHYKMPLRVTKERAGGSGIVNTMSNFDEDWTSLEMRVLRFETEYAWSEDPPSRTRHVVSNIRVKNGEGNGELDVKSYFLLFRFRGDNPTYDLLCGERHDVIRYEEGSMKIAKRLIILDQTTLNTMNLGLFF